MKCPALLRNLVEAPGALHSRGGATLKNEPPRLEARGAARQLIETVGLKWWRRRELHLCSSVLEIGEKSRFSGQTADARHFRRLHRLRWSPLDYPGIDRICGDIVEAQGTGSCCLPKNEASQEHHVFPRKQPAPRVRRLSHKRFDSLRQHAGRGISASVGTAENTGSY